MDTAGVAWRGEWQPLNQAPGLAYGPVVAVLLPGATDGPGLARRPDRQAERGAGGRAGGSRSR
jgi:hypothetical protein